ncbi:MAG TPA: class I SAM-dependent methyltransferase [Flavisolibacter sp.]|jgi:ubiquinone/menaquinone biosynthesis C-methylase UbiE|nr:class I SAM-dependent methyltransferase [Flavisolibacter sp.]
MAKDLFSEQAAAYAKYRPHYPQELFDYILSFVPSRKRAWDCATGNGQSAVVLSRYFEEVEASDISEAQLSNAVQQPNIRYRISAAENTPYADDSFDLITIATAYHWLDGQAFFKEASRVGKEGCVVAAWAYHTLSCTDPVVNSIIQHFYTNITGPYWDPERRHIDEGYRTVVFDFDPLPPNTFHIKKEWTREEFKNYLLTWSSVQKYLKQHQRSPIPLIAGDLDAIWNDTEVRQFHFPVFLRMGQIHK